MKQMRQSRLNSEHRGMLEAHHTPKREIRFQEHEMNNFFKIQNNRLIVIASLALLGALALEVQAQVTSSRPADNLSLNDAKTRYEADKKLCADEASAEARLQCRRDAQTVYDKAIAANKASTAYTSKAAEGVCTDCGHVTAVNVHDKAGQSNAVGLIAGGVAGAVLGHQVGGGMGKDLATVAGAAGGAYAGKKIQENMNSTKVWTVSVKYTDGRTAKFEFAHDPGLAVGTAVKNSGNSIVKN
jgi:outer membrane lipoprotein SlyB